MNGEILAKEITALSVASHWVTARLEWTLHEVFRVDEPETCLCGHFPIIEICILRNTRNNNTAQVGNVCVKKLIGLPSDKIFDAFHRILADLTKPLNIVSILYAHEKGWISEWERDFSTNTARRRRLSDKQLNTRMEINKRVIRHIDRRNR